MLEGYERVYCTSYVKRECVMVQLGLCMSVSEGVRRTEIDVRGMLEGYERVY